MQVVLLIWTDGKSKVPISMRLWQKGGKSKVELATEMLREACGELQGCGTAGEIFQEIVEL